MKSYKKSRRKQKNKSRKQRAGASILERTGTSLLAVRNKFFPIPVRHTYAPISKFINNDDELITISRQLGNQLMLMDDVANRTDEFWIRKRVMDSMPLGCLDKVESYRFNFMPIDAETMDNSIKIVSKLFNDNGLKVKNDDLYSNVYQNTNIEVHFANAGETPIGSGFGLHEDNYTSIGCPVHTLIVYLDIDCEGGMLEYLPNSDKKDIVKVIDPRSPIRTKTKVVMFDGGMMHCPTPVKNGTRLIVTYQFKQEETRGGSGSKPKSHKSKSHKDESCPHFEGNVLKYGMKHGIA